MILTIEYDNTTCAVEERRASAIEVGEVFFGQIGDCELRLLLKSSQNTIIDLGDMGRGGDGSTWDAPRVVVRKYRPVGATLTIHAEEPTDDA